MWTVSQVDSQSVRAQGMGCRPTAAALQLLLLHGNTGAVSVKLQSTELGLWLRVCMGGMCSAMSTSDCTWDVLLNHLQDLDLPTILVRTADRSEP